MDELRDIPVDFVIAVCDKKETCPFWPGPPISAHWGSPDPAAVEGEHATKRKAFIDVANQITARINIFCAFRDEQLDEWHVQSVGQQFKAELPGGTASQE